MPYCPVCKKEFSDQTLCPDDKVDLVDQLPYQTVDAEGGTWVEIASASTDDEARIIAGFLEAEGIPSQVESLKFTMEPVNFGSLGEIRVYVSAEDEAKAIELLEAREDAYDETAPDGEVVTDEGSVEITDDAQTAVESEEK